MKVWLPLIALLIGDGAAAETLRPYQIEGDAIAQSLTGKAGEAARGQAIIADRQHGLCLLCHAGDFPEPHMHGNLAPDLREAVGTLSAGQLRLRLVDIRRVSPDSPMPSFYRNDGLTRVGAPWRGKSILTADEIEDVVAYLLTLQGHK